MDKQFAIFDMDGTLVDSMGYWMGIGREYLAGKGITENLDELMERTRPMTMPETGVAFVEEFHLTESPEQVSDEISAIMAQHYRTDVPLKPGAMEYLEQLHRRGVRMCVASSTAEPLIQICLARLGLTKYFEFVLSCEDIGAGKSQPAVFLEAARRFGSTPQQTAVYEDSLMAAQTAKTAGFYTVGVFDEDCAPLWPQLQNEADEAIADWRNA